MPVRLYAKNIMKLKPGYLLQFIGGEFTNSGVFYA